MSLEDLFAPQDTPIIVGSCASASERVQAAVYLIDFGETSPSHYHAMLMLRHVNLDIDPSRNGNTYYVTSGKVAVELTPEVFDKVLSAASPAEKLRDISRSGTPLFSSCIAATKEGHERFVAARAAFGGCWLLVILAEDATEMLILSDGTVYSVTQRKREDYVHIGQDD